MIIDWHSRCLSTREPTERKSGVESKQGWTGWSGGRMSSVPYLPGLWVPDVVGKVEVLKERQGAVGHCRGKGD